MPFMNERLRELRERDKKHKISREEVAQHLNTTYGTIANWELGRSTPNDENIEKLATFFNVSTDYLLGITTVQSSRFPQDAAQVHGVATVPIPIIAELRVGPPILATQEGTSTFDIPVKLASTGNFVALRVLDDAMLYAGAVRGSLAIVRIQETVQNGEIAVVFTDSSSAAMIRQVQTTNNIVELHAANPAIEVLRYASEQVKIFGKVILFQKETA